METTLVAADYAVIVLMLLVSSAIGIYYWYVDRKEKSTEEYFVANRSMSAVTVAIGLMASYLSAVSLLGVSSENYVYGTQYAVINISYGLATLFVVHFYMPVFFKLGATSAFEYLQKRFGNETRLVASIAFFLQLLLYTGVVLYAPALALEATTNIPRSASVIGIGLVCTFYSAIGGIKAVLITDVFQSCLMLVAVVIVIVTAAIDAGGIGRIWQIAAEGSRLEFDNVSLDPTTRHTWWSLTFGGFFTYLSLYGVNQVQVQRMLTVQNLGAAKRALWWSWPMASIMSLTMCFSGLAIYSKYRDCDPLESGRIASSDQLMPLYVMDTLSRYPGIPGLFIAGIFSAGLSTISATVNSLAAVILEDYVKPVCLIRGKELTSRQSIIASKFLALTVGLMCLGVAFLAEYLGGILQAALTIFGVVGGPMLGLFTLGMFSETGSQKGAIVGLAVGLCFSLWIGFGQPKAPIPRLPNSIAGCNLTYYADHVTESYFVQTTDESPKAPPSYFYLYRLSYMWYGPLGFLVTLVCGFLSSCICRYIFNERDVVADTRLFSPIIAARIEKRRRKEEEEEEEVEEGSTCQTVRHAKL